MRVLKFEEGGRPLANNDLDALQSDLYYAASALLHNLPPHVVANVQVYHRGGNSYDVGFGVVWLGGQLLKFGGASGVSLPAEIILGDVVVYDQRPYETGVTKDCITEQTTTIRPLTSELAPKILVTADGALRYAKVAEAQVRGRKEVQFLGSLTLTDYDTTGRGKYGTEAYGWALPNGDNGTDLMAGLSPVIQDPSKADYDTVGKTGGEEKHTLTVSELPSFTPKTNAMKANGTVNRDTGGSAVAQFGGQATVDTIGGDQPHENRPPYFVLAARQWVGF